MKVIQAIILFFQIFKIMMNEYFDLFGFCDGKK